MSKRFKLFGNGWVVMALSFVLGACSLSEAPAQPAPSSTAAHTAVSMQDDAPVAVKPLGTSRRPETTALPFFSERTFTPQWLDPHSPEAAAMPQVGPFELVNQQGRSVTAQTFTGKVYVADFFFTTCPGICKRMTENMRKLQDAFLHEPDVLFISHSVTPDVDDVPRLAAYAETNGVRPGKWHLVTGDVSVIYRLGREAYFLDEDQGAARPAGEFLHTENFVLVDRMGRLRGVYNGLNRASLQQLARDIDYLLSES